jgi:hypothetical protein
MSRLRRRFLYDRGIFVTVAYLACSSEMQLHLLVRSVTPFYTREVKDYVLVVYYAAK